MNRVLRPVFMTFLIVLGGVSTPLFAETAAGKAQTIELADSSVNFVCRPWVKTADYWDVYNALPQTAAPETTKPESAGNSPPAQAKGDISKGGDTDLDVGG
jgi:hypothetical protein